MGNTVFAKLPFDPIILFVIMALAIVVLAVLLGSVMANQKRLLAQYRSFMKGKDGKTLEDALYECYDEIDQLELIMRKHEKALANMDYQKTGNFQKFGIVHYDAFQEMGGKLSFALAMLSDSDSGFIMNVMHSTEGCYTYMKEIVKGESYVPLAEEEAEALEKAMNAYNFME